MKGVVTLKLQRVFVITLTMLLALGLLILGAACGAKPEGAQLSFNQLITGKFARAGQEVTYFFRAEEGMVIYLQNQEVDDDDTLNITLEGPDGLQVFKERAPGYRPSHGNVGPVTLRQAGNYMLKFSSAEEMASSFSFIMWHVDPPVVEGTITFDHMTRDSIAVAGQTVVYTIDLEEGQSIFLEVKEISESDASLSFYLERPDGLELFSDRAPGYRPSHGDVGPVTVTQSGTYTLTVTETAHYTTSYGFVLWNVDPLVIDGGEIAPGDVLRNAIAIPGQSVEYTFTAEAGTSVFVEMLDMGNSDAGIIHTLTGPDGLEVFSEGAPGYRPSFGDTEPVILQRAGTYTFTVTGDGRSTTTFELRFGGEAVPAVDDDETAEDDAAEDEADDDEEEEDEELEE